MEFLFSTDHLGILWLQTFFNKARFILGNVVLLSWQLPLNIFLFLSVIKTTKQRFQHHAGDYITNQFPDLLAFITCVVCFTVRGSKKLNKLAKCVRMKKHLLSWNTISEGDSNLKLLPKLMLSYMQHDWHCHRFGFFSLVLNNLDRAQGAITGLLLLGIYVRAHYYGTISDGTEREMASRSLIISLIFPPSTWTHYFLLPESLYFYT